MMATQPTFTPRVAKEEGTIADIFTTLGSNADTAPLPARFAALKKEVLHDLGATPEALRQAWNGVLKALEGRTEEIIAKRGDVSTSF
jgi:hypothetical protein